MVRNRSDKSNKKYRNNKKYGRDKKYRSNKKYGRDGWNVGEMFYFCGMAKDKINKTNAARLLDRAKIENELIDYTVDENNLAATHVAEELGEDIKQVFKTLVLQSNTGEHLVCVVPGDAEVDLKKAAKAAGAKKVEMIAMKELLGVTGYIRGGCSPIGMKKPFRTFFDASALEHEAIYVSAGVRGLQIKIAPAALIEFVGGTAAELISDL